MDELMTSIPAKGCQLKWDPHEPWGVPADELVRGFKPSVFTSGYIKSKAPVACHYLLSYITSFTSCFQEFTSRCALITWNGVCPAALPVDHA